MAPTIKFTLQPFRDRQTSRFHVRERVFHTTMQQTGDFRSPNELYSALEEGLREAIQNVLQEDTDARDTDTLYFDIGSSRLSSNYRSWGLRVKSWKDDPRTVQAGFAHLVKALNSNESFTLDDSFTVNITRARPPVLGSGKTKGKAQPMKPGHKDSTVLVDRKKSIVHIKNGDEKCCARALSTAQAIAENHEKLERIRKGKNIQEDLAVQLHYAAKVPFGPCGLEELKKFQKALPDYRIVVVNVKENHKCLDFGVEGKPILALEYNEGHFNVITSLKGYFRTSYFCPTCLKGYQDQTRHNCQGLTCIGCKQDDCGDFSKDGKPSIFCSECQRWFYGEGCFENHQLYDRKGEENLETCICNTIQRCKQCKKLEVGRKNIEKHQCGYTDCPNCKEYVDLKTHECYIQTGPQKKKRTTKTKEIVCFDIEATQVNGQHKANLIMAETMVGNEERTFYNLRDFINWVDELSDDGNVEVTVIAHNLQGYDGYFVVDEYYNTDQNVKQIRNGAKILYIGKDSLRFIDSMSFIAMPLSAFPKTFGLKELKKGYFPHLFNRPENYEYVGPVPAKDYYMPEGMSVDGRKKFETWHAKQIEDGYVFNFMKELHEYCRSDVRLLKEGCRVFMEKFQQVSSFNPFEKITIASACNQDLRENHLESGKIALEPAHGWFESRNQSRVAREYLHLTQKKLEEAGMTLQHRDNGGEYQIPGTNFHVDGYCPETNTVYEFLGDYWHGCPVHFKNRSERHYRLADRSFHEVYKETQERLKKIRNLGYQVETIWECEWRQMREDDPELKAQADALQFIEPLNPRDTFSGGRTETFKLYASASDDQPIGYYDYKSLYPWVNKTQRYPVGMPQQILNPDTTDISEYFGLMKCRILAPYGLYLPVLPVKGEKLTFPLCQKCVEDQIELPTLQRSAVCRHTREERTMLGTWCTPELVKAVELGYEVIKIYEVWHFPESEEGLFETYVNTWLKWKEEASGWADDVVTEEEKEAYIQAYYAHEGILLDKNSIEFNAGMRAVAKIALNSMWGKFGQNDDKIHMISFTDVHEYAKFLAKDSVVVCNISVVNDSRIEVFYKYVGEDQPINPHTNVFIAAFTTCYGRLRLYEALERAGQQAIYGDTDSIISKGINFEGLTGPYLGQLQNELKSDDFITEFVSGGPKNYGFITSNGKETCKVKGFSLNSEGSSQMNYNLMRDFILNEVERPKEKPRMKQIHNTHQIVRDPKNYELSTEPGSKFYRLVFDKRVIDPITKDTWPYGYFQG